MATVWDSGNKSASISLGRMSVVAATNTANGTWKALRATTSQSSGKKYLEMTAGYVANNGNIFGFGNSSLNTASFVGSDANSFGYQSQGSGQGGLGGWTALTNMGEVVQIAIDLTNKLVWARTERHTNWNGSGTANPATATGGYSYSTTGALFPAWSGFDGSGENSSCLNAGGFTFTGTIPSGFSAWDTGTPTGTSIGGSRPTTWDPANKNANVALSGGNLTATQNSATSTWAGVRSTTSYDSGQVYYELTITAYDGVNGIITGVADSSWPVATNGNYPGIDAHSTGAAVGFTGWYYIGATNSGQPGTTAFALSRVMGFAVDLNRGLIWVKDITAGANWNNDAAADPVVGTRGAAIATLNDVFIAFSGDRNTTSDALLMNAGATSFTGTIPSGYSAWDVGPSGSSPANRRGNMSRGLQIR